MRPRSSLARVYTCNRDVLHLVGSVKANCWSADYRQVDLKEKKMVAMSPLSKPVNKCKLVVRKDVLYSIGVLQDNAGFSLEAFQDGKWTQKMSPKLPFLMDHVFSDRDHIYAMAKVPDKLYKYYSLILGTR